MPLDDTARLPFADLPNRDMAAHLLDTVDLADIPKPTGWNVLVLNYVRPSKIGSIHVVAQTQREDEYQGFVGYVLALGQDAYDAARFPSGPWVKPGDWVSWPRLKGTATRFPIRNADGSARVVFSVLADDAFTATNVNPERYVS